MKLNRIGVLVASVGGLLQIGICSIPYSTSFESPTFNPGGLNGQDGWISPTSFTVTNSQARSGSQSVKWSNFGGASGTEAFKDLSSSASPIVLASTWIYISSASDSGYYFGLRPYFNDSFIGPYADVVFNKDGDVRATQGSSGNTSVVSVGNIGNVGNSWVQLTLGIDLNTDQVSAQVGSLAFALPGVSSSSFILDIDLYSRPISPGANTFGEAYFDDYQVSAVPEPFSLGLMASGAILFASKKRRHR